MANLGSTCYFNSGLQVLAHAKSFVEAVRAVDGANKDLQTIQAFKQFIESQCEDSKTAIDPAKFFARFTQIDREYFDVGEQRDSLDAVNYGLEALDDELAGKASNPAELFKFQVRTTTKMVDTEEPRVEDNTFMSLPVEVRASDKNGVNVKDMVQRKFSEADERWEVFEDEIALPPLYRGEVRQTLVSTPRLLLISIDRTDKNEKLRYPVNFEQELQIQADGQAPVTYTLIGVSHHSGSHTGGHYYSDVYHPDEKKWYRANDSSFEELDNPFPAQQSGTAHFLLYQLS